MKRTTQLIFSLLILLYMLLKPGHISAQTDTKFWFAAPSVTWGHPATGVHSPGGRPIYFRMAAIDTVTPTTVTISQPANEFNAISNPNGFPTQVIVIPPSGSSTLNLTPYLEWMGTLNLVENNVPDVIASKGFYIEASNYITCYYELDNNFNRDIFPLKGRNALGTEFFTPFQNQWRNPTSYDPYPYSSIDIVATEDNTVVEITPTAALVGHPANVAFTVTLNKGQTYSARALGQLANQHLMGTYIKSNKPVAVTIKDDSVHAQPQGCRDLIGDQIIPTRLLGREYIVMRGIINLTNTNLDPVEGTASGERVFILAVEDSTEIFINGLSFGIRNKGQTLNYEIRNNSTYINSTKPVYVLHTAGFGCELGGAVLPTIEGCTGSTQVTFYRTSDLPFYMNLMVRKGYEDAFRIVHPNGTIYNIPATWFEDAGTSGWVVLKTGNKLFNTTWVPINQALTIENTKKQFFHMGFFNGNRTTGCKYGYFSDYNVARGEAFVAGSLSPIIRTCYGDTAQLVASGGISYNWSPTAYLSDPYAPNPRAYPPSGFNDYEVTIKRNCFPDTLMRVTVFVAPEIKSYFTVDKPNGCAPHTVRIHNRSTGVHTYRWDYQGDDVVDSNSPDEFREYTFENNTDTVIVYRIQLSAENLNGCTDFMYREIHVFPKIEAGFTVNQTEGCQPLEVQITNTSSGNIRPIHPFLWEVTDGNSYLEENPVLVFQHISPTTRVDTIRLVAHSPFGCTDTAYQVIRTFPRIEANFTIDTVTQCSPLEVEIRNVSLGVDTFFWSIGSESFMSTTYETLYRTFENKTPDIQYVTIQMTAKNDEGCVKVATRELTVYPEVIAQFLRSPEIGCDSMLVTYTNMSNGPPGLQYLWTYGDGGSSDILSPQKIFTNKGNASVTYQTKLLVKSPQQCVDSLILPITVHPYVSSQFTFENPSNCTPFPITLHNQSVRGHQFDWTFGGGSTDTITTNNNSFGKTISNPSPNTTQNYTIGLRTRNNEGCEAYSERVITVYPQVIALFNPSVLSGCNPLDVRFTNQSTGGSLVYAWDFGNNNNSSLGGSFVDNQYINTSSNDTVFKAKLRVTNPLGCFSEHERNITVYGRIKAGFTINKADGCSPLDIQFTNTSDGGVQFYNWNFGDGTGTTPNPIFNRTYFNLPGNLPVQRIITLTVQNNHAQCTDVWRDTIMVYPAADARFEPRVTSGCNPLAVKYDNFSNNRVPTTYAWEMGNGASSTLWEPDEYTYTHYEPTDQIYQPKLTATTVHGCAANTSRQVTVFAYIRADFASDKSSGCSPLITRFTNSSVGGVANNNWNFGDNIIIDNNSPVIQHEFRNRTGVPVDRVVRLTVRNTHPECTREWTDTITVYPEVIPVVNFDSAGCSPHTVRFLSGNTIAADYYKWTFSDGQSSSDQNPQKLLIIMVRRILPIL
jgi:PKD repeat protein